MALATFTTSKSGLKDYRTPTGTGQIPLGFADDKVVNTMVVGVDLNGGTMSWTFKGRPISSGDGYSAQGAALSGYAIGSSPFTLACQKISDWSQVNGGTAISATDSYLVRGEGVEVIMDISAVTGSPKVFVTAFKG